MSGPWVPTGREYDSGATSGKPPPKKPRARRVWEKITRQKGARHEVHVRDGVGESKTITSLSADMERMKPVQTRQQPVATKTETTRTESQVRRPAPAAPAPPNSSATAPAKRRRTVRVSDDVLGPEVDASNDPSDTGRAGTWERGLSDAEIRRRIGPIMRYDDDT